MRFLCVLQNVHPAQTQVQSKVTVGALASEEGFPLEAGPPPRMGTFLQTIRTFLGAQITAWPMTALQKTVTSWFTTGVGQVRLEPPGTPPCRSRP